MFEYHNMSDPSHITLDSSFGTQPFPDYKMTSEEIVNIIQDILKQPVSQRTQYAALNHNDFVLLYPRLFRSVTSGDNDFDISYLKRMLNLIDSPKFEHEKAETVIRTELGQKFLTPEQNKMFTSTPPPS